MARPSLISLTPKTRNKAAAAKWVKRSDTRDGTACPKNAERTVITIRAEKAAEKTSSRGCRIAIKAATRKVLSPISENMIIVKESMNEWNGWITPPASSSGRFEAGVFGFEMVSNGSLSESESGLGCGISWGLSGSPVGFYRFVNYGIRFCGA
jgi:hypothetical protein